MKNDCIYCGSPDHTISACPLALEIAAKRGVILVDEARSDADDAMDSLRLRMIGWRVFSGQVVREMREAGLSPSPETLALQPEPTDE